MIYYLHNCLASGDHRSSGSRSHRSESWHREHSADQRNLSPIKMDNNIRDQKHIKAKRRNELQRSDSSNNHKKMRRSILSSGSRKNRDSRIKSNSRKDSNSIYQSRQRLRSNKKIKSV